MADFKTHIGASTAVGIGYGAAGHLLLNVSPSVAVVAAGLCGVAGMLPDVDSDSGKPVQEVMGFAAAVIPLLLMEHLRRFGLERDSLVAVGVCMYVVVRFGLGELLRRNTVHRGMWHSLPAAAIAAMVTSLLCLQDTPANRWFKVAAVTLGYLVHLSLDELYSIEWYRGKLRTKKSSGTAMKIWGPSFWANGIAFTCLVALAYLLLNHPLHRTTATAPSDRTPLLPREASHQPFDTGLPWQKLR
jgi:membrane-bound metal-dependent hydrolase YbcI (DUF457 family)